jgi:Holliday junction resolvase RusA-like endonuclease
MARHLCFIAWSKPIPKARPRFGKNGAYTDKRTTEAEDEFAWFFNQAKQAEKARGVDLMFPWEGPIEIELVFGFERAKTNRHRHHITHPDIDNLAKTVLDGLNGLAYCDDRQIMSLKVSKTYAVKEGTIVIIREICKNHEDVFDPRTNRPFSQKLEKIAQFMLKEIDDDIALPEVEPTE